MPLGAFLPAGAGAADVAPEVLRVGSFSPTLQRESIWPLRSYSGVSNAATRVCRWAASSLPPMQRC